MRCSHMIQVRMDTGQILCAICDEDVTAIGGGIDRLTRPVGHLSDAERQRLIDASTEPLPPEYLGWS